MSRSIARVVVALSNVPLTRIASSITALAVAATFVTTVEAQITTRVSLDGNGVQGNYGTHEASISSNGRVVAFHSASSNLVAGDTNNNWDIFAYDRTHGTIRRVSHGIGGAQPNGGSVFPSISTDGRFIAFDSYASNLVSGDSNTVHDVFVHDKTTDAISRVSVSSSGAQADEDSILGVLSGNGRYVAFVSWATNLVPGDSNERSDVFLFDRQTGQTSCMSVALNGVSGDGDSYWPAVSSDGAYIAFESYASDLVPNDTNARVDIFVRHRASGQTTRANIGLSGTEASDSAYYPSLSSNGRFVTFESRATNLVVGDTNASYDVFRRDMQTGTTVRASVATSGVQGNDDSNGGVVTWDGRYVVFASYASNLTQPDGNAASDVFVRDLLLNETRRASLATSGAAGNFDSAWPSVSADGRFVAFESDSTNLVGGDTNGASDAFVAEVLGLYFPDADGDSYGNGNAGIPGTSTPPGYVSDDSDCDDTNPAIHPGAVELCDGIDNDCDEEIDGSITFLAYYFDGDGDGFGDPTTEAVACAPPTGYVVTSTDCDDANPAIHPGATEVCNGLDDDCDGIVDESLFQISTYCTAGTTVHGCVPWIEGEGSPSATLPAGFDIVVNSVEGARQGLVFYGFYPAAIHWSPSSPSYRCVAFPLQRTDVVNSGGIAGQCNGELRIDFNAWMRANPVGLGSPFVTGQVFYAQGWFRDSGAPKGTNLSDGLRFTLCN